MRQYLFALTGLLLQASAAYSMSVSGSSVFFEERPAFVAIGRSVVGLKSDLGRSSDWLNRSGERRGLGEDFSEKIMTENGVVERSYHVETVFTQFTPYWGYGLTSSWSIYAAVPITHVSSEATASYSLGSLSLSPSAGEQVFEARDKAGPRAPVSDQEDTLVGQFFFVSQMELVRRPEMDIAFVQKLRVPTGEPDSLAYYTSGAPEASGYGLELGILSDFDGPYLTQWLFHVKGALNFSDTIYATIDNSRGAAGKPGSGKVGAPSGIVKVRRDPGETVEVGAGVEKEILPRAYLATDYSYIKNFGDKLAENAIAFAEESEAHIMRGALAYRPPTFLNRGRYGDPIYSGRLIYSQVIAGKNVPEYQALGLEISLNY